MRGKCLRQLQIWNEFQIANLVIHSSSNLGHSLVQVKPKKVETSNNIPQMQCYCLSSLADDCDVTRGAAK